MVTNSEAKDRGDCAFLAFCPGPAANLGFEVAGETLPRPQLPRQPRPGATWSARRKQAEGGCLGVTGVASVAEPGARAPPHVSVGLK